MRGPHLFPPHSSFIDQWFSIDSIFLQAIREVGEVLQFYDADRKFPAWGFGGRIYDGSVSHCFDLSPNCLEVGWNFISSNPLF